MIKIPRSMANRLETIFQGGSLDQWSDGQLLDSIVESRGPTAEQAFAALVDRHGPMVLRVCRDRIGNSHDAEDAFQAVFLVLARRAGSVRRRESVAGWLFGVARKVSARVRRDSARRREHERRKAELLDREAPESPERESWEDLYQELDRLPERYRSAVVLCHLEGMSHEQAAFRLGCPLRTLQSRLLRARSKLRDRLSRRQTAPQAGVPAFILPELIPSPLPAALADATARITVAFWSGSPKAGVVPATVASLAEGVLAMTPVSPWKLSLAASMVLALAAGVAWAMTPGAPPVPVAPIKSPIHKELIPEVIPSAGQLMARGVVVDEQGKPVAGAMVLAKAYGDAETRGLSGEDGTFAFPVEGRRLNYVPLLARSADGNLVGAFRYEFNLTPEQGEAPVRIVVRTGRTISVQVDRRVNDGKQEPVADGLVEVVGSGHIFGEGKTNTDGLARLTIPIDASVQWVIARKSGQGFDYAEYGLIDEVGRNQAGAPASEIPNHVDLLLDGARTVQIRAVDAEGKAVVGVGFYPWLIKKEGRRSDVNLGTFEIKTTKTDKDGIAMFDWLPPSDRGLTFWPQDRRFSRRRVVVEADATAPLTTTLNRLESIRGRVTRPDGSPAPGIKVEALGTGQGSDNGRGSALSAKDGAYEMAVDPGEAYVVSVDDENWAAPSRLDVVILPGKPVDGIDFRLSRGTLIRGTVTIGPKGKPAPKEYIRIIEATGKQAPAEVLVQGDRAWREVQRQFGVNTDAEGHYSIRVGPGSYKIVGPPRTGEEKITVQDEAELVRDYQMPRPEKGPIAGQIVEGSTNKGVPGAKIEIVARSWRGLPFVVTADEKGHFQAERQLDKLVIHAWSSNRSLGTIIEVGADETEVVIPIFPTATASGFLIDEQGKPAAKQPLSWGRYVPLGEEANSPWMTCFAPKVVTDATGKFTLPDLVIGQDYHISVQRGNVFESTGLVHPEAPGPIDLGPLRIGGYRPPPTAEEMSSFRKGKPEVGDVAPPFEGKKLDGTPLKLEEFRGKFVLLDFWATWCGPCIGEIPQLQAVHDKFAKDGRFAILSLSVDEKIDEPRAFQEKRKLPWSQGFLGEGIHSPIPGSFGVKAIPAFVLVGPDGKIVAKGMRGEDIGKAVAKALEASK